MAGTNLARFDVTSPGQAPISCSVERDLSQAAPSECIDDTPFSFAYTGKHDGGQLLPPKENVYGHVLAAVGDLKEQFETEMRKLIAVAFSAESTGPELKRARVSPSGAAVGATSGAAGVVSSMDDGLEDKEGEDGDEVEGD